jgi:hypothetical protein
MCNLYSHVKGPKAIREVVAVSLNELLSEGWWEELQ